jgi:hypothetical protein
MASHVRHVSLIELGPFGVDIVGLNFRIGHRNLQINILFRELIYEFTFPAHNKRVA